MDGNKGFFKSKPMKIFSIVICCVVVAAFAGLTAAEAYFGGQMKTLTKLYTAVTHGVYADYTSCFYDGAEHLSQNDFDALCSQYELDWTEDYHLKAEFVSRKKTPDGKYMLTVKVTTYNDASSISENQSYVLSRSGGKWQILD